MKSLEDMTDAIRAFAKARDWEQFHSPKNLTMALSVEVSELMEHFQWLTEEQSRNLEASDLDAIKDELADVQIYLLRLADQLKVDIPQAVARKIERNNQKYPVEKARGTAKKYDRLDDLKS